eukprot:CAMPEP_0198132820 /NCGR_PEP_ID=MMETSP1442-20131203/59155_1 /TAXON_ID= /ORGANISM="Craspedostauros australis, Strain CCMP3328" /LENGTH=115 /DNA_ID=CAMNT_0043793911 /DNA_START=78 /DNA_END=425 /DNA_ORIENTATION=-
MRYAWAMIQCACRNRSDAAIANVWLAASVGSYDHAEQLLATTICRAILVPRVCIDSNMDAHIGWKVGGGHRMVPCADHNAMRRTPPMEIYQRPLSLDLAHGLGHGMGAGSAVPFL